MKPLKKHVALTIDEDVLEEIRKLADWNDRSLSQYINLILKKHLEKLNECDKTRPQEITMK